MSERGAKERMTDQYDTLLRSFEEGLIVSLNNEYSTAIPTDELTVLGSRDDKTHVELKSGSEYYRIHRNRGDELVYSEVTEDGLDLISEVFTIEVLGLA